jgi:hypothetical protein
MDSLGIIPGDAARNAAANRSALAPITQTESVPATSTDIGSDVGSPRNELRARLYAALPDERIDMLRDVARSAIVTILRLDPADAPSRKARLMDFGLDSLMAVQLRNLLDRELALSRPLPATIVFDHPTIDALAAFLAAELDATSSHDGASDARNHSGVAATATTQTAPTVDQSEIADMSEEEVARLLFERLDGTR